MYIYNSPHPSIHHNTPYAQSTTDHTREQISPTLQDPLLVLAPTPLPGIPKPLPRHVVGVDVSGARLCLPEFGQRGGGGVGRDSWTPGGRARTAGYLEQGASGAVVYVSDEPDAGDPDGMFCEFRIPWLGTWVDVRQVYLFVCRRGYIRIMIVSLCLVLDLIIFVLSVLLLSLPLLLMLILMIDSQIGVPSHSTPHFLWERFQQKRMSGFTTRRCI